MLGHHGGATPAATKGTPNMNSSLARVRTRLAALFCDTRGANMVEYMIVVGVIALAAIGAFTQFGSSVKGKIQEQGGTVSGINAGSGG
jgi:pilus assembly protein Flp/PilA